MKQGFIQLALKEAKRALRKGEVPIGAVIVRDGKVIARAHNMRECKKNAVAHAEVLCIQKACKRLRSWRLSDCEIYVTLEPCQMCMGAIINARLGKVYFGAKSDTDLNWKVNAELINCDECGNILKTFFASKRKV